MCKLFNSDSFDLNLPCYIHVQFTYTTFCGLDFTEGHKVSRKQVGSFSHSIYGTKQFDITLSHRMTLTFKVRELGEC